MYVDAKRNERKIKESPNTPCAMHKLNILIPFRSPFSRITAQLHQQKSSLFFWRTNSLYLSCHNSTLLQTTLNAQRHISGNQIHKLGHIFPLKRKPLPNRRLYHILIQTPKESLSLLSSAGVLARKRSNESGGFAIGIELRM